jgi:hypothetical protein
MNVSAQVSIQTEIRDVTTGNLVKRSPVMKNLVLDKGLSAMARSAAGGLACTPARIHTFCQIGSGTNPNIFASGGITFTQVTTTLTASAGFFTSGMVGGLFKYGTGSAGAEYYITGFTSTTVVTVGTSATVSTPTVGTVWMVHLAGLQTPFAESNTYQTNANDCETTFAGNIITHKRTFIFGAGPYTVNEIGYSPITGSANGCGRLTLSSSDVIGSTNFYVVIIAISFTYTPSAPTASPEVGTNIAVAGNAMIEYFAVEQVASNGTTSTGGSLGLLDGAIASSLLFATATYTQNATIATAESITITGITIAGTASWTYVGGTVGKMQLAFSGSLSTAGQSLFGLAIGRNNGGLRPAFDIKFTATQTAPTGTFQPITTIAMQYGRTLVN